MTDYEYIIKQLRKCHFTGWDDKVMRECIDKLPNLSRQELTSLSLSKWAKDYASFRESIFNILFADKIGMREQRIKELDTDSLIAEFEDKTNGNVSLIRSELRNRYKENRDREKIAIALKASNKGDKQWILSQEKIIDNSNAKEICLDKEIIADENSQ